MALSFSIEPAQYSRTLFEAHRRVAPICNGLVVSADSRSVDCPPCRQFAMESTLHRQLKSLYTVKGAESEVKLGRYRIDVVDGQRLIEIQHAGLSAIRDKIARLLENHSVTVVKPIIERRYLVSLSKKNGKVVRRRLSPKRGNILDLFDELIHFTRVFPHPNLTIEVPLVDIEEFRFPGHGRRRRWRKRDFVVQDRELLQLNGRHEFRQGRDLVKLVGRRLPRPFDTAQLAKAMKVDRWFAQRVAYCFRKMGIAQQVGKRGNALLYELN
jgi:hypothetical protein